MSPTTNPSGCADKSNCIIRSRSSVPIAENMSAYFATRSARFLPVPMSIFLYLQKYGWLSTPLPEPALEPLTRRDQVLLPGSSSPCLTLPHRSTSLVASRQSLAVTFARCSGLYLTAEEGQMTTNRRDFLTTAATAVGAAMTPDLNHAHQHDHEHQAVPSDLALRVKALESLLVEKGLVDRAALDTLIDAYEHKIGPRNGARVVARAWADSAYKQRLLTNADAAIAELGYGGMQGEHMVVVENTLKVHNMIVCTLCSCYPWPVLGLPPVWYKSTPYRSRSVIDPRGVLREFGVELGEDVDVRVWDSTAELRYLVLPERPAGTEKLSVEALAALVTRDAMVGVAKVTARREGNPT